MNQFLDYSVTLYNLKNLHRYSIYRSINAFNLCLFTTIFGVFLGILIVTKSLVAITFILFIFGIFIYILLNAAYFKNSLTLRICTKAYKFLYKLVKM